MMGRYVAVVEWSRPPDQPFTDNRYSRAHEWSFDGGAVVPASASPLVVGRALSDPAGVDPEEAMVAALSSCHMLFFLSFAAQDGWVIDRYTDQATGTMGPRDDGREVMLAVELDPDIAALARLHHRAHDECFLANSVRFPVTVRGLAEEH